MQTSRFHAIVHAPFGAFGVSISDGLVAEIVYLPPGTREISARDRMAERTVRQLERYLTDPEFRFDLPMVACGTDFQRRVWREISAIRRGRTRTYGDLAKRLTSAPRAVGQACGRNPFPPVVPCHRVVGARDLGGFANQRAGFLLDTKRWLLEHEGWTPSRPR